MSDGGKGDKRRPAAISSDELKERWDTIFKPKQKETDEDIVIGHRDCPQSCTCVGPVEPECRN